MNELMQIHQNLYLKDVERLLQRRTDSIEKRAIKDAFARRWSSIETAKLLSGANARVDRQNDLA